MQGTVKKFLAEKAFGFIKVDGRESDVFFHIKQWPRDQVGRDPQEGDVVSFDLKEDTRNPGRFSAENIKVISAA
jgi:cold shock CspA family protein